MENEESGERKQVRRRKYCEGIAATLDTSKVNTLDDAKRIVKVAAIINDIFRKTLKLPLATMKAADISDYLVAAIDVIQEFKRKRKEKFVPFFNQIQAKCAERNITRIKFIKLAGVEHVLHFTGFFLHKCGAGSDVESFIENAMSLLDSFPEDCPPSTPLEFLEDMYLFDYRHILDEEGVQSCSFIQGEQGPLAKVEVLKDSKFYKLSKEERTVRLETLFGPGITYEYSTSVLLSSQYSL